MNDRDLIRHLSEFHYKSMSANDFSKKIGIQGLWIFYYILLNEKHGKVFYEINENNILSSVCIGFHKYKKFKIILTIHIFPILIYKLLTFQISLSVIFREAFINTPHQVKEIENSYLGFIGCSNELGIQGPLSLAKNYKRTVDYLKRNESKVWGSTLFTNKKANQFLLRNKFKIVGENISGKNFFILEI